MERNFRNNREGDYHGNLSPASRELLDPVKGKILSEDIDLGVSNSLVYQKYNEYRWPLWITEAENYQDDTYRASPGILLLNSGFREWQCFTNFLSSDRLLVDRSGMISGPGNSPWSVEFWLIHSDTLYVPQKNLKSINSKRHADSGIIDISGSLGGAKFRERIAGWRSSINEAIISYELNIKGGYEGDHLYAVIRPYTCTSLSGVDKIEFDRADLTVRVNGKKHFALEQVPDSVLTGSGATGDINFQTMSGGDSVTCRYGMAAMALGMNIKKHNNIFYFRISLDADRSLMTQKLNFETSIKEFGSFTEIKLKEGISLDIPDSDFMKYFRQSKLTILNIDAQDLKNRSPEAHFNLYFLCYAMNKIGLDAEAEKLLRAAMSSYVFNRKRPEFSNVIRGAYIICSFYECYNNRRETRFLQEFYPILRQIGDYIYAFSTDIHSVDELQVNTLRHNYIKSSSPVDMVIIYMSEFYISYLSRSMGIFGDESKFKSESDRLQSIVRQMIENSKGVSDPLTLYYPLFAYPDRIMSGYKDDDYAEIMERIFKDDHYPVIKNISGIDLFTSAIMLIHMLSLKDRRFTEYVKRFFSLVDDFFILPEFIDPGRKRGVRGEGNSKTIASVILAILRNCLLFDSTDRLEIFPVPDARFFVTGNRIKIDGAPTRYGRISFNVDITEKEIKMIFISLPKYIPAEIVINFPYATEIIETDEFRLKRRVGNSFVINGWPSIIRFSILRAYSDHNILHDNK